jgi:CHAT domain-containing protein/Tfp pilus assembly protein PilF
MHFLFLTLTLGSVAGGVGPVTGTLAPGQVYAQELTVGPGQSIHLKIQQAHLDAEVRIIGTDGTVLGSVDNAVARGDPLTLTVISPAPGLHRIEIRLRKPTSSPGTFRLTLDPPQVASDSDRRRMEAERLRAQADQRAIQQEVAVAALAREEYQRSAEIWSDLDDPLERAVTLTRHAQLLEHLGELQPAKNLLDEALVLWRRAGDVAGEVDCLDGLGLVITELGDPPGAVKVLEQALEMRRRIGPDPSSEGSILNDLAVALGNVGDKPGAVERYTEALECTRRAGDKVAEANVLKNRAVDLGSLGQIDRALADFREAQALFRTVRDPGGEAIANYGIGNVLMNAERPGEALRYFQLALPVLERSGDERFVGFTWTKLGLCHLDLRQYDQAAREFQTGLEKLARTGDRRSVATTEMNLARTLLERGRAAEALDGLRRSRDTLHALGDRGHEVMALTHLARAERALGHLDEARKHVLESLQLVESVRSSIAGASARASYLALEHVRYQLLVDILMDLHARSPLAGWNAQALGASELARARSLLELLGDARVDIRSDLPASLREAERALDARIQAERLEQQRVLGRAHSAGEADRLEHALEALSLEWEALQSRMRASSPRYAGLTRPTPLSLGEIRAQVLDPSSALVEFFLGDERSFVWVVSAQDVVSAQLPPRRVVEAAAARLHRAWSDPAGSEAGVQAAASLSRMVLGPVAPALRGKRLVVAADGALHQIPFAALPMPGSGRPLLRDHEVVAVPSASTVALLRTPRVNGREGGPEVAVLADPVFGPDDSRLRGRGVVKVASVESDLLRSLEDTGLRRLEPLAATRREAQAIATHAGEARTFSALGFEASRATALGPEVARARVVHFASHALLDPKRPELSGIVLSLLDPQGKSQPGFLSVGDVSRMHLAAELVVLSACRTGLGKEVRGEGPLGLTRGFMHAGAPRVVASLWKVSDQATAALMDRFYRALLVEQLPPAAALRTAQLELRAQRRFSAPFAWAGFVLQGEWQPMGSVGESKGGRAEVDPWPRPPAPRSRQLPEP